MKFLFKSLVLLCVPLVMCTGCGAEARADKITDSITSVTQLVKSTTEAAVNKIADQGVLKTWALNSQGNLHDPTIVVRSGLIWETRIGMDGVNAHIDMETGGDGTQLPSGTRESLLDALKGLEPGSPQWASIMQLLAQDRLEKNQPAPAETRTLLVVPAGSTVTTPPDPNAGVDKSGG